MASTPAQLRIWFCDFWDTFDFRSFWLYEHISAICSVRVSDINPDLVIFSTYGQKHLRYRCHKIYYSHENTIAPKQFTDFSFCFRGYGTGHHFFSNLAENEYFDSFIDRSFHPSILRWQKTPKTKFCNFVYGNRASKPRIRFCRMLMEHKHVDCPGRVLNNMPAFDSHGYIYDQKYEFLKDYRFTIAFENESEVHYTTEKILHPLLTGSIPIYWGNPNVAELFNPESFINCHQFSSFSEVIAHVLEVEKSPSLLKKYQNAQPILPNSKLHQLTSHALVPTIKQILHMCGHSRPISQSPLYPARASILLFTNKTLRYCLYTLERIENIVGAKFLPRARE